MVRLTEVTLLLVLSVASSVSGLVIKPVTEADLNTLVQEQLNQTQNRIASVLQPCESVCPFGWVKFDGRCFRYFSQVVDWTTAEAYCLNLGANLVSMHSESEYQMVKTLVRTYDSRENPTWIGLSSCQKRFTWIWSDGTKFSYSRWKRNEPNHQDNECCVHMNWGSEKNWNDIPCQLSYPFVCVKRLH